MSNSIQLGSILACPDDHAELKIIDKFLQCSLCMKKFPITGNVIDMRSTTSLILEEKGEIESDYLQYYTELTKGNTQRQMKTFGIVSSSIPTGFVKETLDKLFVHVKENHIVCDIGAGSGDYSIPLATKSKLVLHCDLDTNGITLAQRSAKKNNIDNIFFLICDYFKLPIKDKIMDLSYSIDVIERGEKNDINLLREIIRITKNGGLILFDCHSKERASLTHIVPKILKTYSRLDIITIVRSLSLKVIDVIGTGFLPQIRIWSVKEYRFFNKLTKIMRFPPARWLLILKV